MAEAKNVYSVHDSDGRISMSNKVFDDENGAYGRILADREMAFVNHVGKSYARVHQQFVDRGSIRDMEAMPIRISRTRIGLGDRNGATLTRIPIGARMDIYADGLAAPFFSEIIDGPRAEISAPVPGRYTISITKFPFLEWRREVIAT